MFKKAYIIILISGFFFFLVMFNLSIFWNLSLFFNFCFLDKLMNFSFNFILDFNSIYFFFMVFFVTSLVVLFSEYYMETYNNNKFLFLSMIFFFFMLILSCSGSMLNLMVGWDGLGISSLFLIMFYPNKITFFNSFLTFFFNRLGDLMLMIFFFYLFVSFFNFYYLVDTSLGVKILLIFCLLTKSAQIPFSSWLPAAMSAPTPISAMVHSSTLVTAGLFVMFKFYFTLFTWEVSYISLLLSMLTFLMGGFLGIGDLDLKKVVAFSTMSQISMIIFFVSSGCVSLGFLHTLGHAFFKTLLFCYCGFIFLWFFSNQSLNVFSLKFQNLSFFLLISIFNMSGMIFSSSFYTKDLVLENFLEEKSFFLFFFLILGSIFTIFYSVKIFQSSTFFFTQTKMSSKKVSHFIHIFLFTFFSLLLFKIFNEFCFLNYYCYISNLYLILMNMILISIFFLNFFKFNTFNLLNLDPMFLKTFSFSKFSAIMKFNMMNFSLFDSFFFKPSVFNKININLFLMNLNFWKYTLFLSLFYFF